jgi:hypothetical protein
LIAKAFGYDNWNILAAKIDAARPRADVQKSAEHGLLYCSFCGKNQHEVRKLVAGPAVYICDECVDLCTDIVDDQLLRLIKGDEDSARAMSSDRLLHYVEHAHELELEALRQIAAHPATRHIPAHIRSRLMDIGYTKEVFGGHRSDRRRLTENRDGQMTKKRRSVTDGAPISCEP